MPRDTSATETPIPDAAAEHLFAAYEEAGQVDAGESKAASMMTDDFLLRAYERTSGEQGSPEADALLDEIKRRNLDL